MSNHAEAGLRERKRVATQRSIQHAALTLALERGMDKMTIEEISRIAKISPRTFFNYFPSKDAALVGDVPGFTSDESLEAFVHGGPDAPLLPQLADLLVTNLLPIEEDREIHLLRRTVLRENTQLIGMRMATLRGFEMRLQDAIERRLAADDPSLASDKESLTEQALLFTLIAVATTRHAWRCWADSVGQVTLSERVKASFGEVYKIALQTR
ncbi:TetR family transcriptional regulator [Leifsonia sp. A12D58]|uniref:TetR family transcriptional regulator n=1 Tax=Leifsonia sp. A12D58 TaxID=3397674 RepID=UPI0039E06DA5